MVYMGITSYTGDFENGLRSGFGVMEYNGKSDDHLDVMG